MSFQTEVTEALIAEFADLPEETRGLIAELAARTSHDMFLGICLTARVLSPPIENDD